MRLLLLILLLASNALQQTNPTAPTHKTRVQKGNAETSKQDSGNEPKNGSLTINSLNVHTVQAQSKQTDSYDARKDTLYRAYLWFTIIGVLGAWFGIIVIYCQTKAIRKSTGLQEIAFVQWIEIKKDWKIEPVTQHEGNVLLDITFGIVNPTSYPITLEWVKFDINGHNTELRMDRVITPHETHFFGTNLWISPDQEQMRQTSVLSLFVDGSVELRGVLAKKQVQFFSGGVACEKNRGYFVDRTRASESEKKN
jgi:hypothetical protein